LPRRQRRKGKDDKPRLRLPVRLRYRNAEASGWLELAEEWRVTPSDELLTGLREVQGQDGVRLKYR